MNSRVLVAGVLFRDDYESFLKLRELAESKNIRVASINDLYMARGKGDVTPDFTVPAVNLRGMTYQTARTLLRSAKEKNAFWIFEIARSEMGYTGQFPMEYAAEIIGAAIDEGWEGPLFLQGDHFQFKNKEDLANIKNLVDEALQAGFYNIDIDGSTLVELDKPTIEEQQKVNIEVTKEVLGYIRSKKMETTISVGGEIGHIGERNSTARDMDVFLSGLKSVDSGNIVGLSKVSVQTGTRHGGVIASDGKNTEMKVDFKVIEDCGKTANTYGVGGVVQHGASTLTDSQLSQFPSHKTMEIHLATGWQNLIMDNPNFPSQLMNKMKGWVISEYRSKYGSDEECMYRERKRAWGKFQEEVWNMEESDAAKVMEKVSERADIILTELGMNGKRELLTKYIK